MPYTKNLEALKKYYPDIYIKLTEGENEDNQPTVEVETAKNGEKIVKVEVDGRWVYLNSRYNPTAEADKYMSDMYDMPEESIMTIFGLANGMFARAFVNNNINAKACIIYEPCAEVFRNVLYSVDISDLIQDTRISLTVKGVNDGSFESCIGTLIMPYNMNTNKHIVLPKYAQLFPVETKVYGEKLKENYIKVQAVNNTIHLYGKKVCKNNIHNLRYLSNCSSSVDLVGKFSEDLPGIIVAAGPSLEKNIEYLKNAKGKSILAVVDTAIPRVLKAGIIPDFVIAMDFIKPAKYFESPIIKDVPIVFDADANYEILDMAKPNRCIFYNADSMIWAKLFEEEKSEIRRVNTGGSVATALISNYIHWGIRKIIFVGMDLALTDSKGHVGEVAMEIDETDDNFIAIDAIGGGQVYTRWDFLSYIRWIENAAAILTDVEFVDATEGGALMENTKVMTLQEAIDTYCTKEFDVAKVIDELPVLFKGPEGEAKIKNKLESIATNLRKLKRKLSEVSADCHRAVLMMERKDYNKKELKRINDVMEKFETSYVEMDERVIIEKSLSDAETEFESDLFVIEKDELEEAFRLYKKSEKYYRDIAEAIPELIDIIQDCIEKMEKED